MSRIDDELEQAVREVEGAAGEPAGKRAAQFAGEAAGAASVAGGAPFIAGRAGADVREDAQQSKGNWKLLAAIVALMGVILTLVFSGGGEAVTYSYQVDEIKARAAEFGDRQVRVQGTLVPGTLSKRFDPCEHAFMMRKTGDKTGEALSVIYPQCVVPDTFREVKGVDVEVTAEGRLAADGHLQATKIFAKCPSKYEMRDSAGKMGGAPEHGGGGITGPQSELAVPRAVETAAR
jgi:cytochrome c-type biogenesis protein CcmE